MLKRPVLPAAFVSASLIIAVAAPAADPPKASSATQAPALTAQQSAMLAKVQHLGVMDARFKLTVGVPPTLKATSKKKQISCGVLPYPPTTNPAALSRILFYVNDTGYPLPRGVVIQWEVEGYPAPCCKGFTSKTQEVWEANPPTTNFMYSTESEMNPPQSWTRPCKAWAIVP